MISQRWGPYVFIMIPIKYRVILSPPFGRKLCLWEIAVVWLGQGVSIGIKIPWRRQGDGRSGGPSVFFVFIKQKEMM